MSIVSFVSKAIGNKTKVSKVASDLGIIPTHYKPSICHPYPHQIPRSSGNRTKLGSNLFSTPAPRVLNS